jgi:hypothetical protein
LTRAGPDRLGAPDGVLLRVGRLPSKTAGALNERA